MSDHYLTRPCPLSPYVTPTHQFFHLPSAEAADKLGMSNNHLKRMCRRLGLERWPYRKVASLESLRVGITADDSIPAAQKEV